MARTTFPKRIQKMIHAGWEKGATASEIAERINKSTTARKLNASYTTRQIAASMAWHTMRNNRA